MGTIISYPHLPLTFNFYLQLYNKAYNLAFFSFMIVTLSYTIIKNDDKINYFSHISTRNGSQYGDLQGAQSWYNSKPREVRRRNFIIILSRLECYKSKCW